MTKKNTKLNKKQPVFRAFIQIIEKKKKKNGRLDLNSKIFTLDNQSEFSSKKFFGRGVGRESHVI